MLIVAHLLTRLSDISAAHSEFVLNLLLSSLYELPHALQQISFKPKSWGDSEFRSVCP